MTLTDKIQKLTFQDLTPSTILKEYKEAIKIAPYIAILYRATAAVCGELKDYAQAINYMNIYLDLMPDAPDARAVKDQIYKWEFMMEKGGK